jgi:hypothetical protein
MSKTKLPKAKVSNDIMSSDKRATQQIADLLRCRSVKMSNVRQNVDLYRQNVERSTKCRTFDKMSIFIGLNFAFCDFDKKCSNVTRLLIGRPPRQLN